MIFDRPGEYASIALFAMHHFCFQDSLRRSVLVVHFISFTDPPIQQLVTGDHSH